MTSALDESPSVIARLANTIAEKTAVLDAYLKKNGLPPLSFDRRAPLDVQLPPEIEAARTSLWDAATELAEIAGGPRVALTDIFSNVVGADVVTRLGIWTMIPDDDEGTTYQELSTKTGVPEGTLKRVMRLLVLHRLFAEENGRVKLTNVSRILVDEPEMAENLKWAIDTNTSRPIHYIGRALQKFPRAEDPWEAGASLALTPQDVQTKSITSTNGARLWTFHDYLEHDPETLRRFVRGLELIQERPDYAMERVLNGFDWAGLPDGSTVVDVGGGHGSVAYAVTAQVDHVKFVVQDKAQVVEIAQKKQPTNSDGKVRFMVHDFFQPQPVHGAQVYLLRLILHNWSDKYVLKILRALIPALETGAQVLIMDLFVPPHGHSPNVLERALRNRDLNMLALFNAGDREIEQYRDLITQVDSRLKFKCTTAPDNSSMALLEAVWQS